MGSYSQRLVEDFKKLVDINTPIIYIHDYDFVRVDDLIKRVVFPTPTNSLRSINRKIREWNPISKITAFEGKQSIDSQSLEDFLLSEYRQEAVPVTDKNGKWLYDESLEERFLVLKQVHDIIDEPAIKTGLLLLGQRRLYDNCFNTTVIIVSTQVRVPEEINNYVAFLDIPFPNDNQIEELINEHIDINKYDRNKFSETDREKLMPQLRGLTVFEVDRMLDRAMSVGGTLSAEDTALILAQKKSMVKQAGVLELIDSPESLDSIGGMNALKDYIKRKAKIINDFPKANAFGANMPKGIFIVGMPGCGKSLCAKATARLFNVPLLKLDMGSMMGKYVGDSEANLRKAIKISEAAAPCVLWIDEIEKAFSGVGGHNDVLTRMFGYFLSWMQEKEAPVYVVGTANDAEKLPPELKRKGRFDEIFCVNLPKVEEREAIFNVHFNKLKKGNKSCIRGLELDKCAKELAQCTEDFNGADIEAIINETIEIAFANGKESIDLNDFKEVANNSISIKMSCGEQISKMIEIFELSSFKDALTGKCTKKESKKDNACK